MKRGTLGIITVFGLVTVTLYMAFAFPYTLLHLKQSETTEIKSVIVVARNGERTPKLEDYFIGEEPSDKLQQLGHDELTNTGKERMYLLGKYLKMKYYNLLLNGNPRKLYVRSADSDRCLESAQSLLAGLNPPRDHWAWMGSLTGSGGDLAANWQPKAVHSADLKDDDLLSSESNCLKYDTTKTRWKNSTRYQQLINEFRHDLQQIRQNTGLEFEDDLEMLTTIEDSLRTRLTFDEADVPAWYTSTFASRLAHIADMSTTSRFSEPEAQRLYAGRLLHEIVENINGRIRVDKLASVTSESGETVPESANINDNSRQIKSEPNRLQLAPVTNTHRPEPNMFIYMTDKQHLSALMNSLQVFSSQPLFGSLLLIELHHDPINQAYFLRLFTLSSVSPNVFPEPVRVNPIACVDSIECEPQQFEQNIRHLTMDKLAWQTVCMEQMANINPTLPMAPTTSTTTMKPITLIPSIPENVIPVTTEVAIQSASTINQEDQFTTSNPFPITSPMSVPSEATPIADKLDQLDQDLIVGPIHTNIDRVTASTTSPILVTDSIKPSTTADNDFTGSSEVVADNQILTTTTGPNETTITTTTTPASDTMTDQSTKDLEPTNQQNGMINHGDDNEHIENGKLRHMTRDWMLEDNQL